MTSAGNNVPKHGATSKSEANGFISAHKYKINGFAEFLRDVTRGEKKMFADKWGIKLRTLNDIQKLSALTFSNWQKLQAVLGENELQKLHKLCPEGWGGNKTLITKT